MKFFLFFSLLSLILSGCSQKIDSQKVNNSGGDTKVSTGIMSTSSGIIHQMQPPTIEESNELCSESFESGTGILDKSIHDLFKTYKNIALQKEAQVDWSVFNLLAFDQCDVGLDDYSKQICDAFIKKDLPALQSNPKILPEDLHTMQSIITGKNACGDNEEICRYDVAFTQKIISKNIVFPQKIDGIRLIELYTYNKLYPKEYSKKLKELFMGICIKKI